MSNQTLFKTKKHTLHSEEYSTLDPKDCAVATNVCECLMVIFSRDYAEKEDICNNLEKIPIKDNNCIIL